MFGTWLNFLTGRMRRPVALTSDYLAGNAPASEDAFQAGLELAVEGMILLDGEARVVALNSCAQALMHSGLAVLQGADFWDALPEDLTDKHRTAADQALQASGTCTFVCHYAFEDQWVECTIRRHSRGLMVNLRDVTPTHRALRLLHNSEFCNETLFDANPLAMWLFDAGTRRLLAVNQAAAVLHGLTQDELAGRSVEVLFPDGEGAVLLDSLPLGDFQQQMRLCTQKKANGEHLLVELACGSLQWKLRPAVLVSVVDVGARHLADAHLRRLNAELEQRLEQSRRQMQRSQNELQAFTYAMSHDLKAPLHVISGFAKTLAERHAASLDDQGRHFLERIQASTLQLSKLIDDLRTLTYLPRVTLIPELVDLAPVCQSLVDELCQREPKRQLVLEIAPQLLLRGDKTLLITALSCLIDNAWKFTSRKDQGWIKVGVMPARRPGDAALFVSDNGAGFDVAYVDKLFVAFQRLHSSADFPGSGLGLAIVKRVAQMHGGEVWATTTDQGGSSFFMALPQGADTVAAVEPDA